MKFSIIMASYNQVEFIEQAIESVLHQTYQDFELIIVDGLSDDGSQNIIRKYEHLPNVKTIIEKDKGLYHARNKGLFMVTGDIIGFLNTDDYYEPDALKKIISCFIDNPQIDVVYGETKVIDKTGEYLRTDGDYEFDKIRLIKEYIALPDQSTFLHGRNLTNIGLYDTTYRIVSDWDFWLKAIMLDLKFFRLNKHIVNFRKYEETLTNNPKYDRIRFHEVIRLYRKYNDRCLTPFILKMYYRHYIKRPLKNIHFINKLYRKFTK